MRVQDIMRTDVVTVRQEDPTALAAQRMRDANVGCVVVTEGGNPVGILTDRDLAIRCLCQGHNADLCPVVYHMSTPVITIEPDIDLLEAAHLMTSNWVKRMPVVEKGNLVGLVSFSDVAEALDRPLHDLMIGMGAVRGARN